MLRDDGCWRRPQYSVAAWSVACAISPLETGCSAQIALGRTLENTFPSAHRRCVSSHSSQWAVKQPWRCRRRRQVCVSGLRQWMWVCRLCRVKRPLPRNRCCFRMMRRIGCPTGFMIPGWSNNGSNCSDAWTRTDCGKYGMLDYWTLPRIRRSPMHQENLHSFLLTSRFGSTGFAGAPSPHYASVMPRIGTLEAWLHKGPIHIPPKWTSDTVTVLRPLGRCARRRPSDSFRTHQHHPIAVTL